MNVYMVTCEGAKRKVFSSVVKAQRYRDEKIEEQISKLSPNVKYKVRHYAYGETRIEFEAPNSCVPPYIFKLEKFLVQ